MSGDTRQMLKVEHEALRATLKRAMREEGPIGAAAVKVASLADAHFLREEKFVLPLLALLPGLALGEMALTAAAAARLVQGLREETGTMIGEHRQMAEALRELARAAAAMDKADYVAFAEELILHMHREEQVLYPAAIVAGEYLLRLRAQA